jgi:hypothetical protein
VSSTPTGGDGGFTVTGALSGEEHDGAARYVALYYPGVMDPASAMTIALGPGEERDGVDFGLRYVRTGSVDGTVIGLDGRPANHVDVTLRGVSAQDSVLTDEKGRFHFDAVVPGHVTIEVNDLSSGPTGEAVGQVELDTSASDLHGVTINLLPSAQVFGRVTFEDGSSLIRLQPVLTLTGSNGAIASSQATDDGHFLLEGLSPGRYRLHAGVSGSTPWTLKSATWNGQDLVDGTLDVQAGQVITDVSVVFTDRSTDLSGVLTDASGKAASGYVVILFPADRGLWKPGSRRIASAPIESAGRYDIPGLPPGDYMMAAVRALDPDDLANASWLSKVAALAIHVTLAEGEHKKQDLRIGN